MHALLMCGGKGLRLGKGEKPLFKVCGLRLIEHALREFDDFEIVGVTSPNTPMTEKFLRERGVEVFRASGGGFIADYQEACREMSIAEPVFVACTDIVYLKPVAEKALDVYLKSEARALKVVADGEAVGINIIDAFFIDEEQEEEIYNIGKDAVVNINTIEDAKRAEEIWTSMRKRGESWLRD